MKSQLKKMEQEEHRFLLELTEVKEGILQGIQEAEPPFCGIKRLADNYLTIPSAVLFQENCWDPRYYSQERQAEAVGKKLQSCKYPSDIRIALQEMRAKGVVKTGNESVRLNSATIQVLKEFCEE